MHGQTNVRRFEPGWTSLLCIIDRRIRLDYRLELHSKQLWRKLQNTAEDPFGKIYAPNKMEDLNLKAFNMMKGINKSNIFQINADVNLMVENEIQNKNRLMVSANVSVKTKKHCIWEEYYA